MKIYKLWTIGGLAVAALFLIGLSVFSQAGLTPALAQTEATIDLPRTLTVVGEGTVKIKPDTAQATIGVEVVKPNLQEANQEATAVMNDITQKLKEQGVSETDMQTSGFNIWIERPYVDGAPSDQVLYHVSNQVSVIIKDLNNVGNILDEAIKAGANNIYGVNFSIADPSKLEADARSKAIADAQVKAEELADLSEAELGTIVSISEVIGGGDGGVYNNSFQAFAQGGVGGGGPIAPGELTMMMQLQVVYNLQ